MEANIQILSKNTELNCKSDSIIHLYNNSITISDATVFGYVHAGAAVLNGRHIEVGECFSSHGDVCVEANGACALFVKHNWVGRYCISKVPNWGDVRYIDGCTDSLLICPPRLGDACLNSLYFPPNTTQSFHTHDELRFGVVAFGSGIACYDDKKVQLKTGDTFCIPAFEVHRFMTNLEQMVVIAYHPNSDWGPTDECHPMVNKTIITN